MELPDITTFYLTCAGMCLLVAAWTVAVDEEWPLAQRGFGILIVIGMLAALGQFVSQTVEYSFAIACMTLLGILGSGIIGFIIVLFMPRGSVRRCRSR